MSAPKHTPGPWKVSRLAGIPGVIVGGVTRKYPHGSVQDQLFVVCGVRDDNGGDDAQEANSSLIAAAPDLLDELRKALDSLEYVERIFPGMAGCGVRQERISSARSVIEKATGEQA